MIEVTAAIINVNDRFLAARRGAGQHLAGFWEFPGGKIEPGEDAKVCLKRELGEEFGVEVERDGSDSTTLVIHWDHWEPFSHQANNTPENFVAACQVCNLTKSNLVFKDEDEAHEIMRRKWIKKGWRLVEEGNEGGEN